MYLKILKGWHCDVIGSVRIIQNFIFEWARLSHPAGRDRRRRVTWGILYDEWRGVFVTIDRSSLWTIDRSNLWTELMTSCNCCWFGCMAVGSCWFEIRLNYNLKITKEKCDDVYLNGCWISNISAPWSSSPNDCLRLSRRKGNRKGLAYTFGLIRYDHRLWRKESPIKY